MEQRSPVVLRPPLEVMRPRAVGALPEGGRWVFQIKVDGFRTAVFRLEDRVVLQSRSGRNLTADFPVLAAAVERLPVGTVLDAEVVASVGGRMVFEELLRSRRSRAERGVALNLIVFDLLAVPGQDLRARPLADRLELLGQVLEGQGPLVQPVLSTGDRQLALRWYDELVDAGVEGIVAKDLGSAYRPGQVGRAWVKVRHHDTQDALLLGITGSPARPESLMVRLADGREETTSPRLDTPQARQVAALVSDRLRPLSTLDSSRVRWLETPHPIEVTVGTGRHGRVRFVRLRDGD
jgi:ATP-dependent DNA ligase